MDPKKEQEKQRRRLTVSNCDPVVGASTSGGSDGTVAVKLEEAGLTEVFKTHAGEARLRAVACTTVTDKDLKRKRSFAEKDMEVMSPYHSQDDARSYLVDELRLGFCCKKGLKPESPNQDTFAIHVVEGVFGLYGVYDGHGPWGHDVSNRAREHLVKAFFEDKSFMEDPGRALMNAFVKCQQQLEAAKDVDPSTSGTTCSIAFHNALTNILTIAHVGDSRVVFGVRESASSEWEVISCTEDHKPNLPAEKLRIESADPPGRVVFDGYYNHRVFAKAGNYPGLNMSRALGDVIAHKEAGLTAVPEIATIDLKAHSHNLEVLCLLCTDGVWEFIENAQALQLIKREFGVKKGPAEVANKLAEKSWDEWMKDSDHEISDDITVMMIPFKLDLDE